MIRFHHDFDSLLMGINFEFLENYTDTIFALSNNLVLIYFNPAWFNFARDNDGEPAISERFILGTHICDFITGEILEYYLEVFQRILQTGKIWHHDYECSSPKMLRKFYQTVYPLYERKGLLIVNSLVKEAPQDENAINPHEAIDAYYRQPSGLITQCCNCRRIRRVGNQDEWDWVPAWVEKIPEKTSHTICKVCFEFYKLDLKYLYGKQNYS